MENRYLANETLDNLVIGADADKWKHEYIGENEVPRCSWEGKTIYSPVLPPLVDAMADAVVRGKNAHEAGHARLTRCDKNPAWSQLKGNVANALEDLRIEAGVSKLSAAIAEDIKIMNKSIVQQIQRKWSTMSAGTIKPLDEALFAMSIMEQGFTPMWNMSPEAQKYVSAAQAAFAKWREADQDTPKGFATIEKVADEVLKCLQQAKNEMSQQSQGNQSQQEQDNNQQNQRQQGNGGSQGKQEEGEESQEQQGSATSSNGEGKPQEGNEANGEPQEGNNAQESVENVQEEQGEGNNANGDETSENDGENAESEDDGKKGENGEEANQEEGENGEEGKGEGNDKGDKPELDGGDCDAGNQEGNDNAPLNIQPGDPSEDFDGKDFKTDAIKDILGKAIEQAKKELDNAGIGRYTSYVQEDEIREAEARPVRYEQSKQKASGMVAKLRSHLEAMLRSMSRCKVIGNRDAGDLDAARLADLAKSLTRNVFTETTNGISLDTSVTILIDESGSIGDTCQIFQTMAIAFSEALERLGIKYEILGHTTKCATSDECDKFVRARPMLILEHKRFDEPLRKAKYKLGSIGSFGCNADGEALLHAWKRAEAQRTKRHIVFVLSDGEPNAAGRGGSNRTLEKHLISVVNHIRKSGGEVYAIGIGTTSPKRYYGEKYFFYANNESSINNQFFRNIANVIAKIQK